MILGKCGRAYCPSSKEIYLLIEYSDVCKVLINLDEEEVMSLADLSLPQFSKPTAFYSKGVEESTHSAYSRFGLCTSDGIEYYNFSLLQSRSYTPALSTILKAITEHKVFLESIANKFTTASLFISSLDFVADVNYKLIGSKFTSKRDGFFSYNLEFLADEEGSIPFRLEFSSRVDSYLTKISVDELERHLKLYLSCNSQGVFLQRIGRKEAEEENSSTSFSLEFSRKFKILESPSKWSEREQLIRQSKQCFVRCANDERIYKILEVVSKFGDRNKEVVVFSSLVGDEMFYIPLSNFITESQNSNSLQKYNFQLIEFV